MMFLHRKYIGSLLNSLSVKSESSRSNELHHKNREPQSLINFQETHCGSLVKAGYYGGQMNNQVLAHICVKM